MGGSKARAWFVRRDFERGVLTGGPQKTSPEDLTVYDACARLLPQSVRCQQEPKSAT
jgi:hypothetical protein